MLYNCVIEQCYITHTGCNITQKNDIYAVILHELYNIYFSMLYSVPNMNITWYIDIYLTCYIDKQEICITPQYSMLYMLLYYALKCNLICQLTVWYSMTYSTLIYSGI